MTALFNSTHAALAFAFSYSERDGKPNLLGRLSEKERPPGGRGLVGLDGAAQAGMMLRELSELSDMQRAVIIGKFCRPKLHSCGYYHDAPERREAIERIAQYTATKMLLDRPNIRLRRALVAHYFGGRGVPFKELARTYGVHQNTVTNHYNKVREVIGNVEKEAMRAMDERLKTVVRQTEEA